MSDRPNPLVVEVLSLRLLLALDAENWPTWYMTLDDVKRASPGSAEAVVGCMGATVKQVLDAFDPSWATNMQDELELLLDVLDAMHGSLTDEAIQQFLEGELP